LVLVITCVFISVISFLLVCSACLVTRESVGKPLGEGKHLVTRQIRMDGQKGRLTLAGGWAVA
jgi:hypothetical protein